MRVGKRAGQYDSVHPWTWHGITAFLASSVNLLRFLCLLFVYLLLILLLRIARPVERVVDFNGLDHVVVWTFVKAEQYLSSIKYLTQ